MNDFSNEMRSISRGISARLPVMFLTAIMLAYLINAVLQIAFLTPILAPVLGAAAIWVCSGGAFVFQLFRAVIVAAGLLDIYRDRRPPLLAKFVAAGATLLALVELFHTLQGALSGSKFWAVYLFALSVILAGYIAEVMFIVRAHRVLSDGLSQDEEQSTVDEKKPAQIEPSDPEIDFSDDPQRHNESPFFDILGRFDEKNPAGRQ